MDVIWYTGSSLKEAKMEKTNFKKWGWWALGGVVAVAIVTVMVVSMGPSAEVADVGKTEDETSGEAEGNPAETSDDVAEVETGELPQSGPVEDGVLVLLLAGVIAYVMSLTVTNVVRAARRE